MKSPKLLINTPKTIAEYQRQWSFSSINCLQLTACDFPFFGCKTYKLLLLVSVNKFPSGSFHGNVKLDIGF